MCLLMVSSTEEGAPVSLANQLTLSLVLNGPTFIAAATVKLDRAVHLFLF